MSPQLIVLLEALRLEQQEKGSLTVADEVGHLLEGGCSCDSQTDCTCYNLGHDAGQDNCSHTCDCGREVNIPTACSICDNDD